MKKVTIIVGKILVIFIGTFATNATADLDSSQTAVIDTIDMQLRSDYRLCTGDSTEITAAQLFEWRNMLDKTLTGTKYAVIAKKYFEETGLSPAHVRPCEIISWMQTFEAQMSTYGTVLDNSRDTIKQQREDSLYVAAEYAKNARATYDLFGIPFGISRRSFMIKIKTVQQGTIVDKGTYLLINAPPTDAHAYTIACHFTSDSIYHSYEIESDMYPFDSLNNVVRPIMLEMSNRFEARTSTPPDHIYRVGQFDIVPGRLAICRLWVFPGAHAYIGLARSGSSFYAKVIVQKE